jgi:hypothetical protein
LLRKACDAVKDPRRLKAVILHYGYGSANHLHIPG